MIAVDFEKNEFTVQCPVFDNERVKKAPERRWDKKDRKWKLPATRSNAQYLAQTYSDSEKSDKAQAMIKELRKHKTPDIRFPSWFRFKNRPMKHQSIALDKFYGLKAWAAFMEMRTGKSFVAINIGAAHAMEGKINAFVVVVDSAYKVVWEDEFAEHCPIEYNLHIAEAGKYDALKRFTNDTDTPGLKVLVTGVEGYSQGNLYGHVQDFMLAHNCMMVVDESTSIKNATKIRSKRVIDLGGMAKIRAILTGTPITQGIEDLFAQFKFLDWKIIGMKSYFAFKNRYCIMGGFEGRNIVGYTNVGELMENVKPYVYQITADEVHDPLDKVREKAQVEPTKEQKRMFDELGDPFQMMTYQGDNMLEVETVLERMTRYQQIASGLFPYWDEEDEEYKVEPIQGKNPKIEAMIDVISKMRPETKVIIWATFQPEIRFIADALRETYGESSVCEYHGQNTETRSNEYQRFKTDESARFFVTNKSGSKSLELSAASAHIFVSRSFSYETNKQAEARTNSGKQESKNILYVDIIMNHKIDKMIHDAYARKQSMADYVREEMNK